MQELSKKLMCISLRNGIEIWEEDEKTQKLQQLLSTIKVSTFVHFQDQTINTADIVGIFNPNTMDDHTRRKNGQWKCVGNEWHDKGQKCECLNEEQEKIKQENRQKFYEQYGYFPLN